MPGKKTIQSPGKTNSLREAVLFDHTSDIDIIILGELTQSKKLSITPTATAIVSDEIEEMPVLSDDVIKKCIDHEEEINIKLNPKICYPELVGTNLTIDAACTNGRCVNL